MIAFLTSSPFGENERIDPANGLADELREAITPGMSMLFVCSDPNCGDLTDYFANTMFETLARDGMKPGRTAVLDGRNAGRAAELVRAADVIILAGGHVPTQNRFLREIGLKERMAFFDGVVIGISAGTMNSAGTVYAQPELPGEAISEDYERFLPGLGITDVNIIPHYQALKDETLDGLKLFDEITRPDSFGRSLYLLPDGSWLKCRDGWQELRGEAWLLRDGETRRICEDGGRLSL